MNPIVIVRFQTLRAGVEVSRPMYLPPLQPINDAQTYVSGNVTIHPTAAIAPGALLRAEPDSQIIIGSGVCLGMGVVLHARQGVLEVEAGTSLGAGVLVVGQGKIGANACIGPSSTILNPAINSGDVVPSGSLIGDQSRKVVESVIVPEGAGIQPVALDGQPSPPEPDQPGTSQDSELSLEQQEQPSSDSTPSPIVYGQAHLNRLLSTLLPHRQALNRPLQQDGESSSNTL